MRSSWISSLKVLSRAHRPCSGSDYGSIGVTLVSASGSPMRTCYKTWGGAASQFCSRSAASLESRILCASVEAQGSKLASHSAPYGLSWHSCTLWGHWRCLRLIGCCACDWPIQRRQAYGILRASFWVLSPSRASCADVQLRSRLNERYVPFSLFGANGAWLLQGRCYRLVDLYAIRASAFPLCDYSKLARRS